MKRWCFIVVVACGPLACKSNGKDPGWIVLPGMAFSNAVEAYSDHPVIGPSLRTPPPGTVPYQDTSPTFKAAEVELASTQLTQPLRADTLNMSLGAKRYQTYCSVCHGPQGAGDGPIIGRFPNPPNLAAPHAKQLTDGHIFHIITHGQGLMPGHNLQIRPDDRWRIVLHVRALQNPTPAGKGG